MIGQLILSGGGNEKVLKRFNFERIAGIKIKKILYIPIAWKNNDFDGCLKWLKKTLKKYRAKIEMIEDLNKKINLSKYDLIFIGGGNTFKLLKKIKESKFDKKLINYYRNNGIIFGGSAGAIIFGKNILVASICKDADVNEVKLKNTHAMNLVKNYDIQCHFENNQIKEHKKFIKKTSRKILCIPEETILLISDKKYAVLGSKPITLITKKEIKKYQPGERIQ